MPVGCKIYGITIRKNGHGYIVLSTSREVLKKKTKLEEEKGFKVVQFYKGFTSMQIDDEHAPIHEY